jgi:hypothetical protein
MTKPGVRLGFWTPSCRAPAICRPPSNLLSAMHPGDDRVAEYPNPQSISTNRARPTFSTPMLDKFAIVPIAACVLALIVAPLLLFVAPSQNILDARLENRIFWPLLAAISVVLLVQNRSRRDRLSLPPSSVSSRTSLSPEQARCGLSDRRARSLDLLNKL